MQTYHIHIRGRVQGVGFRPYAAALAESRKLRGTVSNGMDGVHICLQTCETFAREFLDYLVAHPPAHSIITGYSLTLSGMGDEQETINKRVDGEDAVAIADKGDAQTQSKQNRNDEPKSKSTDAGDGPLNAVPDRPYGLQILESSDHQEPDLLLTPDIALCPECRKELTQTGNRRNGYAFTTCLHCGPRYSIVSDLPYDRPHTTMADLDMCPGCRTEYTDIRNRRHFSQTNSCPDCTIPMHWYVAPGEESPLTRKQVGGSPVAGSASTQHAQASHTGQDQQAVILEIAAMIQEGRIIAVKGIGGYLLLCDATQPAVVQTLRQRKHRPHKPFAVMYPDLDTAMTDHHIRPFEAEALLSPVAPIVLCRKVQGSRFKVRGMQTDVHSTSDIPSPVSNFQNLISNFSNPTLHRTGIMLPYTPLLALIAAACARPLIATSGNLSGSPIVYEDEVALENLWSVADAILTYDRAIVSPQDDSVWQYTEQGERIILRRSRGMAPDYYPHGLGETTETILATGADLKASFAIHHRDKIYVSQYLGDLEDFRSQEAWRQSQQHLLNIIRARPGIILSDMHPGYFARQEGVTIADALDIPIEYIQHHQAHFAAVLAENNLLRETGPTLGLIWDGHGYGSDGQGWGSEAFIYNEGSMDRVLHLDYFPQIMGDKMSREPRLSALSLLHRHHDAKKILHHHFSEAEWDYYVKLLQQDQPGLTSSMGRMIDAVASILGVCQFNSYEGQAAMELEALADAAGTETCAPYPLTIRLDRIDWRPMIEVILADLYRGESKAHIARRFFSSLAQLVIDIAYCFDIPRVAISGGVFQNALLLDLIRSRLPSDITLYTHQQLSPNDESISFGQLAWYNMKSRISDPAFRGTGTLPPKT